MGKTMIDLVIGLFVNSGFFIGKVFFLLHLHGINAFGQLEKRFEQSVNH